MDSTLVAQAQAFLAAHPWAYGLLSAAAGAVGWHAALTWLETTGVDAAVAWFRKRQRAAAARLGFTPEQIRAAEQAEAAEAVKVAQRAAADLAAEDTTTPPPPAAPKP